MRQRLVIEIETDSNNAVKGIDIVDDNLEKLENTVKKTDKSVQGLWKEMAMGDIVARGVEDALSGLKDAFFDMYEAGSHAIEAEDMFTAVMKSETEEAMQFVDEFADSLKRSRYEVMEHTAALQDTFVPLGFLRDHSRELSEQLVDIGYNISSFKDRDIGETFDKMISGIVGNHEAWRDWGVIVTESTLKAELWEMGISKSYSAVTDQEKVLARLNILMKSTADAQGNAARTMGSNANVMRSIKGVAYDLEVQIGKLFNEAFLPYLIEVRDYLFENKERIIEFGKKVVDNISAGVKWLVEFSAKLWEMRDIIVTVGKFMVALWAVKKVRSYASAIGGVIEKLETAKGRAAMAKGAMLAFSNVVAAVSVMALEKVVSTLYQIKELSDRVKRAEMTHEQQAEQSRSRLLNFLNQYESGLDKITNKDMRFDLSGEIEMYKDLFQEVDAKYKDATERTQQFNRIMQEISKSGFDHLSDSFKSYIREVYTGTPIFKTATDGAAALGKNLDMGKGIGDSKKELEKFKKELNEFYAELRAGGFKQVKLLPWETDDSRRLQEAIELQNEYAKSYDLSRNELEAFTESAGWAHDNIDNLSKRVSDGSKDTKKWSVDWQDANEVLQFSIQVAGQLSGVLGQLGIDVGETTQKFISSAGQLAEGIISKNPMSVISGTLGVIGSVIDALSGDGVQEAIARETEWMGMNEELQESLHELAEEVGDTHAAASLMFSDIMDGTDITAANFDQWADRHREILIDMDRGLISHKEAIAEIGEGWSKLVDESRRLNTEGSAEMIETLRNLRNRGEKVGEIQDYINAQLQTGIDALSQYTKASADAAGEILEMQEKLKGMDAGSREWETASKELEQLKSQFSDVSSEEQFQRAIQYTVGYMQAFKADGLDMYEIVERLGPQIDNLKNIADVGNYESGGLSQLLNLRQYVKDNQAAFEGLEATKSMLESMGNTGYLPGDVFAASQQDVVDFYDKLADGEKHKEKALQAVAPLLAKQIWYSEQYGYELDKETQKLIKKAEQEGINFKNMLPLEERQFQVQEKMAGILERIAEHFGCTIPEAMAHTGGAFDELNKKAGSFANMSYNMPSMGTTNVGGSLNPGLGSTDITLPVDKKSVSGFAEGTGGWLEVTQPTMVMIGEGGENEYFNVVPESQLATADTSGLISQAGMFQGQSFEVNVLGEQAVDFFAADLPGAIMQTSSAIDAVSGAGLETSLTDMGTQAVEMFSNVLPGAVGETIQAFQVAAMQAESISGLQYNPVQGGPSAPPSPPPAPPSLPVVPLASGTGGWVSVNSPTLLHVAENGQNEMVNVVPGNQVPAAGTGGVQVVFEKDSIQISNVKETEEIVKEIVNSIPGNKYGVRTAFEKVAKKAQKGKG